LDCSADRNRFGLRTARDVWHRTPLQRYETTALGASEVTLLELANAYRMMASGIRAEPYVIAKIARSGETSFLQPPSALLCDERERSGPINDPGRIAWRRAHSSGTAHALDARAFPIP
jgi:membrane carboxypeptidase/penicillin-binding protein